MGETNDKTAIDRFRDVRTIVFDYDGTLHDGAVVYVEAFKVAYEHLVAQSLAEPRTFATDDMTKWLGFTSRDMWAAFQPDLSQGKRDEASKVLGEALETLIADGHAVLYEGSLDVLTTLHERGYTLVLLSNCTREYLDHHVKAFSLDRYFDAMVCAGEYGWIPKYEVFERIAGDFPEEYAVVGDRFHDMELGRYPGVHTVGCTYGFGGPSELQGADARIGDIRELPDLLR
ncbi:MAG: HAD family hydrolase [Actinobacteria bacterium]|nr:HAD family hydrolase [Actinomycetota bacterium]